MDNWRSNTVETNGITLHYWRTGGDKPPLLLCHGITDSGLCWRPTAQALAHDFDIIMIDARGHGESSKPESGYSSEEHAKDVIGLIEALDLAGAAVMGHSMGAMTAATLAYMRPDLVSRVVLEDPPWRPAVPGGDEERVQAMAEWREQLAAQQQLPLAEIIAAGKERSPAWADDEFDAWAQAKQQASLNVLNYRMGTSATWEEIAQGLEMPTLLVTADPARGAIVTPASAAVAAANPNITVVQIEGAGHNIRREQFVPFLTAVREFLH